mmetsp:Transcript_11208/g.31664  ORF Transcript_11208/g.31664 Transcript_11208/m.31664 type:complete len:223 (+) Transcript_11208:485-1153(+)
MVRRPNRPRISSIALRPPLLRTMVLTKKTMRKQWKLINRRLRLLPAWRIVPPVTKTTCLRKKRNLKIFLPTSKRAKSPKTKGRRMRRAPKTKEAAMRTMLTMVVMIARRRAAARIRPRLRPRRLRPALPGLKTWAIMHLKSRQRMYRCHRWKIIMKILAIRRMALPLTSEMMPRAKVRLRANQMLLKETRRQTMAPLMITLAMRMAGPKSLGIIRSLNLLIR